MKSKREVLLDLLDSSIKLEALEIGGVDNWSWYGEALGEEYYVYNANQEHSALFLEELDKLEKDLLSPPSNFDELKEVMNNEGLDITGTNQELYNRYRLWFEKRLFKL